MKDDGVECEMAAKGHKLSRIGNKTSHGAFLTPPDLEVDDVSRRRDCRHE